MKFGTPSTLNTIPRNIRKIHQYNTHWVASDGSNSCMYYTTDPLDVSKWEAVGDLSDVTLITSTSTLGFVCVRNDTDVYKSVDGKVWTLIKRFNETIYDILGVGTTLLLVGDLTNRTGTLQPNVWNTTDGISWTFCEIFTEKRIKKLRLFGTSIIGVGNNGLFLYSESPDLSDVQIEAADVGESSEIRDVAYDPVEDIYTVVGVNGFLAHSDPGDISTWTVSPAEFYYPLGLVQNNDLYITGDWNVTYFSFDKGVTWHKFQTTVDITYGNETYILRSPTQIWIGSYLNNLTLAHDTFSTNITHVIFSDYLNAYFISLENGEVLTSATGAYDSWTLVATFGNAVRKILSDEINETLLVVGDNNLLQYTTDLVSWTDLSGQLVYGPHQFKDIIHVPGLDYYVAVGERTVAYSTTAIDNWLEHNLSFDSNITSVTSNTSNVVFCGENGQIYHSSDVRNEIPTRQDLYTNGMNLLSTSFNFHKIVYNSTENKFVVADSNSNVWKSTDGTGTTWEFTSSLNADYSGKLLAILNGIYYAIYENSSFRHAVYESYDAKDWRMAMDPHPIYHESYNMVNDVFLLSTDGTGYTLMANLNDLQYYGRDNVDTSVVVNDMLLIFDETGTIYTTSDLVNMYYERRMLLDQDIVGSATDGTIAMVACDKKIFKITIGEGLSCNQVFSCKPNMTISGICFGNDMFVAYGSYGKVYTSSNQGDTWTEYQVPGTSIKSMCYFSFESKFYGISDRGLLFMSEDGYATYTTNTELQTLYKYTNARIAATDTRIMVIENDYDYATRPIIYDTVQWRIQQAPSALNIRRDRYLHVINNIFVITAGTATVYTTNGRSWFSYNNNSDGDYYKGVHYLNNKYVFIGLDRFIHIHANLDSES